MSKPVRLTYIEEDRQITETCLLVEENDFCYTTNGNNPPIKNTTIITTLMGHGFVVFEDEHGLFCIKPDLIVEIADV